MIHRTAMSLALALAFAQTPASAEPTPVASPEFQTLGTGGGPIPHPTRAQPANLVRFAGKAILVDAGDGATSQLGRAGVPLETVEAVIVSHLHFDHAGGLFALLSRRYQMLVPGPLVIYGPPGTKGMVASLLSAMRPALSAWSSLRAGVPLESTVAVTEIHDGWRGQIAGVAVTAATNTHYAALPESAGEVRQNTYALRFDAGGRSFVYTGDTGPSAAVEKLAKGVDVLFAEVMDPALAIDRLMATRPDVPAAALAVVEDHYRREHLSPETVAAMARTAGVKALVLTHNGLPKEAEPAAGATIRAGYKGKVTFAKDLDRF